MNAVTLRVDLGLVGGTMMPASAQSTLAVTQSLMDLARTVAGAVQREDSPRG